MARYIRPSTTRSTVVLWTSAALDTLLFFGLCMIALPALAVPVFLLLLSVRERPRSRRSDPPPHLATERS